MIFPNTILPSSGAMPPCKKEKMRMKKKLAAMMVLVLVDLSVGSVTLAYTDYSTSGY